MNETTLIKKLEQLLTHEPSQATSPINELTPLLTIIKKYRTLYEIGKLIASEMDLESVLRLAMDKVIEVTQAQHGFVALVDERKRLDFKIARNMERSDVDKPRFEVSRSIIRKVIDNGEIICLPDAMADATFGDAESVQRLQLLSVLCTPISVADQVVGLIYVDSSKSRALFNEEVTDLLRAFSQQVSIAFNNARVFTDLKQSHRNMAKELRAKYQFNAIIGSGAAMTKVLQLVADVADTDAPILIQGESGTGKELIAKALHYNSSRSDKSYIVVNCGAIPDELVESELFGHEKGAFTGAIKNKRGKFELADKGTIFLDEIGELKPSLQVKLLRVLQDGIVSPVGSETEKYCDVRVIAATNRDLKKMIEDNNFREDLYYRLNVIDLNIPPLRNRREDIPLLVEHFIEKYRKNNQTPQLSAVTEHLLLEYDYPGNIRQLENAVQRAVILAKGETIEVKHLPEEIQTDFAYSSKSQQQADTFQKRKQRVIEKWEREELIRILLHTGGMLRKSAEYAGMDVKNFSEKLKRYEIKAEDYKN